MSKPKYSKDQLFAARVQKVLDSVDIFDVLIEVGFLGSGEKYEHNVRCPFHGDGNETHPSGRIFPNSKVANSGVFYCFTCGQTWDPIKFVRDYTGVPYTKALEQLEGDFKISRPTIQEILNVDTFQPKPLTAKYKELDLEELKKMEEAKFEKAAQKIDYLEKRLRAISKSVDTSMFRKLGEIADRIRGEVEERKPNCLDHLDAVLEKVRKLVQ